MSARPIRPTLLFLAFFLSPSLSPWAFAQEASEKKDDRDLVEKARARFASGDYDAAWDLYEKAIERSPGHPALLNEYAWKLVDFPGKSKKTALRALPFARRAVAILPRDANVLDTLAEAFFLSGDVKNALVWNATCRKVSRLSTFSDRLARYASHYMKVLAAEKGSSDEEKARARVLCATGMLGGRKPDLAKVVELLEAAIKLDGDADHALALLGDALARLERHAEAARAYRKALEKKPADTGPLHLGLGRALLEIDPPAAREAREQLLEALSLDPGSRRARYSLARACLLDGDPDEALAHVQILMAGTDDRWQPEFRLEPLWLLGAKAWEAKGRLAHAMELYLTAVLRRGHDPQGEIGLRRCFDAIFPDGPDPRRFFADREKIKCPVFQDVTDAWTLTGARGRRIAIADVDGDGRLDLLAGGTHLWLNRGKRFENVSGPWGLKGLPSEGAAFGDGDGNGKLDLYVANYEHPMSVGNPDRYYVGRGDGRFDDRTAASGLRVDKPRCGRGVTWADVDGDGDQDIHVSNYRLNPNFLWINDGSGRFENRAKDLGIEGFPVRGYFGHTIGSVFGDVDNDGDLDLFQANLAHPRFIEFSNQSFLFINPGARGAPFTDVRRKAGIRYEETHSDPLFADFDNDGDLDLYVTSVYVGRKSFLYLNQGDGTFKEATWFAGARADNGWGCAAGDLDGDGALDLVVCDATGVRVWRNTGNGNAWLGVRVIGGARSNRDGIGARITLTDARGRHQLREIRAGRGTTSQDPPLAHFGLGEARGPVRLTVRFCCKEPVVKVVDVEDVNRLVTVREDR